MKIKFDPFVQDPINNALITALASMKNSDFENLRDTWKKDELDVVLTINGYEVSFESIMTSYRDSLSHMINQAARDIVESKHLSKLDKLNDLIYKATEEIKYELRRQFPDSYFEEG